MPQAAPQTSFAGGELSPNLFARVDLEKYASGVAMAYNFFVDYRGGLSNRPGTQYIGAGVTNDAERLCPFVFSTDESYVLEFSDLLVTIYRAGLVSTAVATPWPKEVLFELVYIQSADVMTITHPSYPPYDLNRTDLDTFSLVEVDVGTSVTSPTNFTGAATNTGDYWYGYAVTALNATGEESLSSYPIVVKSLILDPTNATPKSITLNWDPVSGATAYNVYKWGPVPKNLPLPTLFGYCGQTQVSEFTDANYAADYANTPPQFRDPFSPGQLNINVNVAGTGYVEGYGPMVITGGGGSGAKAFWVANNGVVSGVVMLDNGKGYTTSPTMTATSAGSGATFTASIDTENNYPAVVSYFQQRRVYGGALAAPEMLDFSQISAFSNFDVSPVVLDSDAIQVNIASREINTIKSLVPMSTGLVVFTTGTAFLVAGTGNGPLTPTNISATPQASTGSGEIQPMVIDRNILFIQKKGSTVRDMAFNFYTQSYYGVDRSMLANHLFFGHTLIDWCYAEAPFKLVWAVRDDGKLLCLAYEPEQEVYGWSVHETNGLVKSVCSIPEGDEDAVYLLVQRYINGSWVNYIERMASRKFDCPQEAWFLDCAVNLPGIYPDAGLTLSAATGTITVTADEEVLGDPSVGDRIVVGCLQLLIAAKVDGYNVQCTVLYGSVATLLDGTPVPIADGAWYYQTPVTSIDASHLKGQTVNIVADGLVLGEVVVPSDGTVDFSGLSPVPAVKVLCGVPYTAKMKTLKVEINAQGTIQGKRKNVPSVNVCLNQTRGLQAGPDFDTLYELKDMSVPYSVPPPLFSGDIFINVANDWTQYGELCFEQSYPLPATILGIVPQVVVGDNQR